MRRKTVVLILILAVLAGLYKGPGSSRRSLTGVSDMICGTDYIYVLDNDGTNYDFLKLTYDGTIERGMTVQKLSGAWWNAYTHLWEAEDGRVYVYQYRISMEEDEAEAAVLLCDFDSETLRPIWELEGRKAVQCQVIGDSLYYAKPAGEKEGTRFVSLNREGEESTVYETDFPYERIISAFYDPEQGLFWSDYNGRLYHNGMELEEAVGENDNHKAHICIGNGRIIYTETEGQTVEAIDFISKTKSLVFPASQVTFQESGLEYKDLLPFHYGEDRWCAGLDLSGTRRVAAVFDYQGRQELLLSEAVYSGKEQLRHGMEAAVVTLTAGALMFFAASFYLKRSGGMVTVLVKMFLSLTPVILAGGMLLEKQMRHIFTEYSKQAGYDLLYALADNRLSPIDPADLAALSLSNIPEDEVYQKLFGGEDFSILPKRLHTIRDDGGEPIISRTYQWVYRMEGASLRYVVVDDNYYGARVDYYRDREQLKLMEKAMDEGVIVKTAYNDQEGNWIALYVPIVDRQGESIGIMESGMSLGNLLYGSRRQTRAIQVRMYLYIALLTLILIALIRLSLSPLVRLKEAVNQMGSGHYNIKVRTKGKDEVADISRAFNTMSEKIGRQVDYIGACLAGYEKFVPQRVFSILEREDITELKLGDHRELVASVMAADSPDFFTSARNMGGEEIYSRINGMLGVLVPTVAGYGGIVDHMLGAGALIYFPDQPGDALAAAVCVCERLNRLEDAFLLGIGITRGTIRVGIVGQKERAAVKTLSESVTLAGYLSKLAVKYGARILITGTAAREIPDFETKYHVRLIGYLKLNLSEQAELLYDAYDGDLPEVFQRKKRTEEFFQAGLREFKGGDYYEARRQFAHVLREDKTDLAARAYVYRCDTYYQMEDQSQADIFLEHY